MFFAADEAEVGEVDVGGASDVGDVAAPDGLRAVV